MAVLPGKPPLTRHTTLPIPESAQSGPDAQKSGLVESRQGSVAGDPKELYSMEEGGNK